MVWFYHTTLNRLSCELSVPGWGDEGIYSYVYQPQKSTRCRCVYIYIYIYHTWISWILRDMQPTQDTFGGICFRWHPNIQFNSYLIGRKHGWVDVSYLHGNLLLPRKWLRCFSTGRPPRFESGTSWTQVRNGETHPRILSRRAWTLSRKTKTKKKTYPVKRPRGWLGWAMEIQWIFERFTLGSWNGGRTKSSWSTMSCYLRRWLGRCIVFLFFFSDGL